MSVQKPFDIQVKPLSARHLLTLAVKSKGEKPNGGKKNESKHEIKGKEVAHKLSLRLPSESPFFF